jgi:hypothetical protein
MTLNIWSCGLDPYLNTCTNTQDNFTRDNLILYAINDILAPTTLFFHLTKSISSNSTSTATSILNSIMSNSFTRLPSLLVISDSHGRNIDPITTSTYHIITHFVSGLQWVNNTNSQVCARSLILQYPLSSLLTSCTADLFMIGTNSVRNTPAAQIIEQIEDVIDLIRSHHLHLTNTSAISIIKTFPCYKPSASFT